MTPQAPPPATAGRKYPPQARRFEAADTEEDAASATPAEPANKLAGSLRDLADKVEKEGKDGSLSVDGLKVVNYKLDVMIFLRDLSDETVKALEDLGFVKAGESKTVKMLVGTIDVRKLEELAKLDAVVAVKPVKS
jgi:hypothetical protein